MIIRSVIFAAVATLSSAHAAAQARWPSDRDQGQINLGVSGSVPSCRPAVPPLMIDSLGPLRPGQPLVALERACPRLRYGWDWGDEGIPAPAVLLRFGTAMVEVELRDTLPSSPVYRVRTESPAIRTADGFGTGSALAAIVSAWGPPTFGVGECVLYVWFASHPGLSFRVRVPASWECEDVLAVEQGRASKLPPGTTVREVLLFRRDK